MKSPFRGFSAVRVVCCLCGWFRLLGHTGSNGRVRALISLAPDPAPCNIVWSRVMEVPSESESEAPTAQALGYKDLTEEWSLRRLAVERPIALLTCKTLVQGRPCPRCKRIGGVRIDLLFNDGSGETVGNILFFGPFDDETRCSSSGRKYPP
jgi:hypothetical protein